MKWIVLMVGLLLASPALAEDGDACTTGGIWPNGTCIKLCDDHDDAGGANLTCGPIRLQRPFGTFAIELTKKIGCDGAGTATIFTRSTNTTIGDAEQPWHQIGTLNLDATDTAGTSIIYIDGQAAPLMAYVQATLATVTNCDNVDVTIHQMK